MAECDDDVIVISSDSDEINVSHEAEIIEKERMECPICLQTCIHPAKLPCGHIFCFLCVKGVAYKNRRCAMCRREIPPEFLDHPELVHGIQELCKTSATDDGYQWFYEGRNGWWQYDERTSQDIEEAYKKGEKSCKILVAGFVYVVDFEAMLQQRQNDPSRRRHVKRDLATIPKKGVAGLRIEGNTVSTESEYEQQNEVYHRENSSNFISTIVATDAAIRIASDIIGSTLAHADEINQSDERQQNILPTLDILEQAEEIMESTQADNLASSVPVVVHADLFSQTLDDFRSLTIRSILDSSDSENEDEHLIL